MNKDFYENLDTNFDEACKLSEKSFSHDELIDFLKNGNIPQKQMAALVFDHIKNITDAQVLLSNLTGVDGKIREAAALSINRIISEDENSKNIMSQISAETLADASIDINANICRLAVDSAVLLKENNNFSQKYTNKIIKFSQDALDKIDKFIFRDKKYVINKQIFKLYWCLEALNYFWEYAHYEILKEILNKSSDQKEYTVREKVAQIVYTSKKFPDLYKKLSEDENYYVKNIFV